MVTDGDFVDALDAAAGEAPVVDYGSVADLSEITVVSKDYQTFFGDVASVVESGGNNQALP